MADEEKDTTETTEEKVDLIDFSKLNEEDWTYEDVPMAIVNYEDFDIMKSGLSDYSNEMPADQDEYWVKVYDDIMSRDKKLTIHSEPEHFISLATGNVFKVPKNIYLTSEFNRYPDIYIDLQTAKLYSQDIIGGKVIGYYESASGNYIKFTVDSNDPNSKFYYVDITKYPENRGLMAGGSYARVQIGSTTGTTSIYKDAQYYLTYRGTGAGPYGILTGDYVNNTGKRDTWYLDQRNLTTHADKSSWPEGHLNKGSNFAASATLFRRYFYYQDFNSSQALSSYQHNYLCYSGIPIVASAYVGNDPDNSKNKPYLIGIVPMVKVGDLGKVYTADWFMVIIPSQPQMRILQLPHRKRYKIPLEAKNESLEDYGYVKDPSTGKYVYSIAETEVKALSYDSIIGLPFKFLPNVDVRPGRYNFGTEYMENIIYDMPIAVIRPGAPVMSSNVSSLAEKIVGALYHLYAKDGNLIDLAESALLNLVKSSAYQRLYSFSSDYAQYIEYVNTLCHMFATFLGIGAWQDKGTGKKYANYDDTYNKMELEGGSSLTQLFGTTPAVYMYYQPNSNLSQTFSNSTTASTTMSSVQDWADEVKEARFMLGSSSDKSKDFNFLNSFFSGLADATQVVTGGNNLYAPEYYDNSSASAEFDIRVRLVSPYGDPESIFLYILRPLARIMALSLPRQYTSNGYRSPFIVQAFSKGQFNCQLGIVENLSISRGGNGGESHTIHNIPTELNVDIRIKDMYELVTLSNEYVNNGLISSITGAPQALGLLINNIGLIDFMASYSGFNINSPQADMQIAMLINMMKNRVQDQIAFDGGQWRFPQWNRKLNDMYSNTVNRAQSLVTG